jgi:hypothetical protein
MKTIFAVPIVATIIAAGPVWGADPLITPPKAFLEADIESPVSLRVFEEPMKVKDFADMIDPLSKCDLDGAKVLGWTKRGDEFGLKAEFDDKVTKKRETLQFRFRFREGKAIPLTLESSGASEEAKKKQPSGNQWVALFRMICARQGVDVGKVRGQLPDELKEAEPGAPEPAAPER